MYFKLGASLVGQAYIQFMSHCTFLDHESKTIG